MADDELPCSALRDRFRKGTAHIASISIMSLAQFQHQRHISAPFIIVVECHAAGRVHATLASFTCAC